MWLLINNIHELTLFCTVFEKNCTALNQSKWRNFFMYIIRNVIIYMKNFLHSDWLRAVQFFLNSAEKSYSVQKEVTNQEFWLVNDQRNSQMVNQIFCFQIKCTHPEWRNWCHNFPRLHDTRVFLLLKHLKNFSSILLISNHMIFLLQFGINKHL